jgi:hypothetical protein
LAPSISLANAFKVTVMSEDNVAPTTKVLITLVHGTSARFRLLCQHVIGFRNGQLA